MAYAMRVTFNDIDRFFELLLIRQGAELNLYKWNELKRSPWKRRMPFAPLWKHSSSEDDDNLLTKFFCSPRLSPSWWSGRRTLGVGRICGPRDSHDGRSVRMCPHMNCSRGSPRLPLQSWFSSWVQRKILKAICFSSVFSFPSVIASCLPFL